MRRGRRGCVRRKFFTRSCRKQDRNRAVANYIWRGYESKSHGRRLSDYVPPAYQGLAVLVSNAGGDDLDTFFRSFQVAERMELDKLEEVMRLRNALADKARDEMKSKD